MKIAICLVFFEDMTHLERLAKSLNALKHPDFKIYFLDNNPGKKHRERFQILLPQSMEITCTENLGYAGGNNRIISQIQHEDYDAFWILNPDMAPEPDSLTELATYMETDKQIFAAGPVICLGETTDDPVIQLAGVKQDFFSQKKIHLHAGKKLKQLEIKIPFFTDSLNGGALLVRAEMSKDKALFEEKYFMYNDETDLLYRIRLAKKLACVVPAAVVFHHHDWSKGNRKGYFRMYYYMMRNKFLFWRKYNMYWPLFSGLMKEIILFPVIFLFCQRTAGRRLVLYYYKGILDGLMNKSGKATFEFI
jgi:hypothetical protein